ncbi:lysine-specific demethylase JMJ30 isoform X1 [Dendrobium catenatum]|uniref:F-box protein n=2 Tax=Dendrobium catenatum TaxID=906689 RepID=A0A2I0WEW1_9ASPA|nr:lysine-specific demethylase JMJ30 isoform X1 [Dendrobium catenatum]PKU74206.1 F-box protein [Dendrobium catenatum]
MGDELGTDEVPFPAQAAGPLLVIIDENRRGLLLRRITEEGGFAFVSSAELAAAGDLRSAEAAREMAWEQLHSGPWDEVVPTWRDAYAMACLLVAGIRASAGDLKEALRVLDMGLIMGGPLLRRELEVAVGKISVMSASNQVECSRRSSWCGLENCRSWNIDEVLQILPSRSLACKAVEKQPSPSLEAFIRDYFLRSYPVIISNYIDHWPALTKWKDVDYLKSIAGDRTVPVEVGKNYLSSDWKQELITFSQFLDRIQTNISSADLTYLAQHPLFDQIKELRNDIMIPDYCYAGGGEIQSLNAWFGPPGTVTPLHHDPHHNIFAQVVGRKYVRLYPESASQDLYPHTESMLKNSSQVDLDNFDAKDFPRTADLDFLDCILEEGELLYIPPKWWHYVRSLSTSFSVSFWWRASDLPFENV